VAARWRFVVGAVIAAVAFIGTGYLVGARQANPTRWHTGQAEIGDHEASVSVGGWTYGFQDSVPMWIDTGGSVHQDGWPDCLGPSGTQKQIRFATVNVTTAAVSWRQVVAVDCRPY
jgi:hypothetical protein